MYLFDNQPGLTFVDPLIMLAGLLGLIALALGWLERRRLRKRLPRGPAYQVFRQDAATALMVWGAAQLALAAGWALRIEGLRMPIWPYIGLLVGVAAAVFLIRRERRNWPSLAKTDGVEQLPDGRVQRGMSQTWEMGFLVAGGAGLLSYLASAGHAYAHPIHWLTTGLSMLPAYALGVAIWSPRFKLTTVRGARASLTAKQRRSAKQRRDDHDGAAR